MHVWKNNNNINIYQSVLIIFTNFESSINSKIIDRVLVSFERERPLWEGPIICIQYIELVEENYGDINNNL